MPINDFYEKYRQPLTEDDLIGIREEEEKLKMMLEGVEKGELRRAEDGSGFINPKEPNVYLPDPVIKEYMGIAMNQAQEQFRGWPAIPEDPDIMLRFPGMDPMGKYSLIDLKFAQREARIRAALATRPPEMRQYAEMLLHLGEAGGMENLALENLRGSLKDYCKHHRVVTRASKLCQEPYGRELLTRQARIMEEDDVVRLYDLYLQGVEYVAGVRKDPVSQDVMRHYSQYIGLPLDTPAINKANEEDVVYQHSDKINVDFQNLENRVLQARFSNPHNWGKTPADAAKGTITLDVAAKLIPPYARATVNVTLKPLFQEMEEQPNHRYTRGDLIIVSGQTVREKMYETYLANGGNADQFQAYYEANYRQQTNEYVAAALMAGKRVEAFVPDKNGKISGEPVQITKTGYEPTALQPVLLNAWERFWSKRGFYKEKTAQAAEYQRMVEARHRVKAEDFLGRMQESGPNLPEERAPFVRGLGVEQEDLSNGGLGLSVTRTAIPSIAICAMLNDPQHQYTLEELFDKNALVAEKTAMGREVYQRILNRDTEWLGRTMFQGHQKLCQVLEAAGTENLLNPDWLYRSENLNLFKAAYVCFDICQEQPHVHEAYVNAAAQAMNVNDGRAIAEQMDNRATNLGVYFGVAERSLKVSYQMVKNRVHDDICQSCLSDIIGFETYRQTVMQRMKEQPGKPFSEYLGENEGHHLQSTMPALLDNKKFNQLVGALEKNDANIRQFGSEMLTGQMREKMKITADWSRMQFGFELQNPAKTMEDSHQLQATDRQNQQPKPSARNIMGGPVR